MDLRHEPDDFNLLLLWLNAEPIWSFPCLLPVVEFKLKNSHAIHWDLVENFFYIPLTGFNSDKSKVCLCRPEYVSAYCGKRWKLTEIYWPAYIIFSISKISSPHKLRNTSLTADHKFTASGKKKLIYQQDASITACGKSSRWDGLFVVCIHWRPLDQNQLQNCLGKLDYWKK